MARTLQKTIPFGIDRLYHDALYLHLIHNGYTPKQAEKEVTTRLNAQMRENVECMKYSEIIRQELDTLPDDSIVLIETTPEKAHEVGLALIKYYSDKKDAGIIVSASRPYTNLVSVFSKRFINIGKMFILDCISKNQSADVKAKNVVFVDNMNALTDISISISQGIQRYNGKRKFVFFDSIPTMVLHNKPQIFARFIHSVLTMMRVNRVSGILVSFKDESNQQLRAEIVQMCDKVINI